MHNLAFDATSSLVSPLSTGVVNGCVYGLVALAIVLVYKSNRFFNFAGAEFGTVAALVMHHARAGHGLPKLPFLWAFLLGLLAAIGAALLTEWLVIRPLFRASRITLVVATAGVALLLIQLELLLGGPELSFVKVLSPHTFFDLGNNAVQVGDLLIVLALVTFGVLSVLFFRSRYGVAILAVSQEPTAAGIVGINVRRISMLTWGLVGLLSGIAGLVFVQKTPNLQPGLMTLGGPLISGFVAAVLGGMTSLPGAFVGGIAIGLVQSYATANAPDAIPGFSGVTIALLLLLVLLVRPRGLLGKEA